MAVWDVAPQTYRIPPEGVKLAVAPWVKAVVAIRPRGDTATGNESTALDLAIIEGAAPSQ